MKAGMSKNRWPHGKDWVSDLALHIHLLARNIVSAVRTEGLDDEKVVSVALAIRADRNVIDVCTCGHNLMAHGPQHAVDEFEGDLECRVEGCPCEQHQRIWKNGERGEAA